MKVVSSRRKAACTSVRGGAAMAVELRKPVGRNSSQLSWTEMKLARSQAELSRHFAAPTAQAFRKPSSVSVVSTGIHACPLRKMRLSGLRNSSAAWSAVMPRE